MVPPALIAPCYFPESGVRAFQKGRRASAVFSDAAAGGFGGQQHFEPGINTIKLFCHG